VPCGPAGVWSAQGTGQEGATLHPNEELIRAGYDAFVRGDVDGVAGFLHPDVLWHVGGSSSLAGVYKGHGELLALLARIAEMTDGSISISARDILTSEDHVIVLTTMKGRRGDRVLDDDGVAVFKIADGKASEVWVFAENQGALDSFFGEPRAGG
jgi:uncharacterized protein